MDYVHVYGHIRYNGIVFAGRQNDHIRNKKVELNFSDRSDFKSERWL